MSKHQRNLQNKGANAGSPAQVPIDDPYKALLQWGAVFGLNENRAPDGARILNIKFQQRTVQVIFPPNHAKILFQTTIQIAPPHFPIFMSKSQKEKIHFIRELRKVVSRYEVNPFIMLPIMPPPNGSPPNSKETKAVFGANLEIPSDFLTKELFLRLYTKFGTLGDYLLALFEEMIIDPEGTVMMSQIEDEKNKKKIGDSLYS
jgi:hypothetical protein